MATCKANADIPCLQAIFHHYDITCWNSMSRIYSRMLTHLVECIVDFYRNSLSVSVAVTQWMSHAIVNYAT